MMPRRLTGLLAGVVAWTLAGQAPAVLIDNGVAGDGFWQINVLRGGESRRGFLDAAGPIGSVGVIFDYFHYIDVGADGGGLRLGDMPGTAPALTGPNEVTSTGSFPGLNGTIAWRTVSSIAPNSPLYLTTLTFTSDQPFGLVRLIQYLDQDVLNEWDDHLVVVGTPGTAGFQLLTVDDNNNVGVAHAAGYLSAAGMSYVGWAADQFPDLRSAIAGPGAAYSVAGVVDTGDLLPIIDPRFPGLPAYGPRDVTSAFAFDLVPDDRYASVILSLGGSPTGQLPPPPDGATVVPEPLSAGLGFLALAGLGVAATRRRA